MAKEASFSDFIEKERNRLNEARAEAEQRRKAVDVEIADIEKELNAIAAYEAAKTGKAASSKGTGTRGTRTTGRTASLLALIQNSPDGIRRADILDKMGVKGDKSGENTVSTALTNLKKQGKIGLADGLYTAA